MSKFCSECIWRCPLYDSEKCAPCRFSSGKPNFEREEHPGYGTKAGATLLKEDDHINTFIELVEEKCTPFPVCMSVITEYHHK
jgi:hypothetical protein